MKEKNVYKLRCQAKTREKRNKKKAFLEHRNACRDQKYDELVWYLSEEDIYDDDYYDREFLRELDQWCEYDYCGHWTFDEYDEYFIDMTPVAPPPLPPSSGMYTKCCRT